jgi:flavin-dependent dehydrogenase
VSASPRPVWDVLVIGAGPAGSASAALLAAAGHSVLVVEREQFPRFHIGESLLPAGLSVLERIGVGTSACTFVPKRGARFVCEASGRSQSFAFADALPGAAPASWHVDRARFDTALRDRARALGATVVHGVAVSAAGHGAAGAWIEAGGERHEGRFLIDASGQDRFAATRAGTARPLRGFGSSAVFTHFEGLEVSAFQELGPDFDIRILVRDDGWGWVIPLPENRLSVGLVSSGRATRQMLEDGVLSGALVSRLTRGATRCATHIVAGYSYKNAAPTAARFAAVGDAACFLDPVFSSGVALALRAAESVADRLVEGFASGREADPELLSGHVADMERAYATFGALIQRFYHSRIAHTLFLSDPGEASARHGVLSVLAGDVWRHDNPFQEMLLGAKRTPARAGPTRRSESS